MFLMVTWFAPIYKRPVFNKLLDLPGPRWGICDCSDAGCVGLLIRLPQVVGWFDLGLALHDHAAPRGVFAGGVEFQVGAFPPVSGDLEFEFVAKDVFEVVADVVAVA